MTLDFSQYVNTYVQTDEIAGQARNDGIGHPVPDPGSHQKCAKKLVLHIRLCFFMSECAFEAFLHSHPIHSYAHMRLTY